MRKSISSIFILQLEKELSKDNLFMLSNRFIIFILRQYNLLIEHSFYTETRQRLNK